MALTCDEISAAVQGNRSDSIDTNCLLPCDVFLGPATVIRKGCKLSTLLEALRVREGKDWNKFDLADAKEALAVYRKAVADVNRMNDKSEIPPVPNGERA